VAKNLILSGYSDNVSHHHLTGTRHLTKFWTAQIRPFSPVVYSIAEFDALPYNEEGFH
jgi:hypothetical protein